MGTTLQRIAHQIFSFSIEDAFLSFHPSFSLPIQRPTQIKNAQKPVLPSAIRCVVTVKRKISRIRESKGPERCDWIVLCIPFFIPSLI
jgi:hypothetical protein